jgi:ATP-dependent protease Clp ATPase subunit
MFDLPSLEGVEGVVIAKQVVGENRACLHILRQPERSRKWNNNYRACFFEMNFNQDR